MQSHHLPTVLACRLPGGVPMRERIAWLPVPLWELYQDEGGLMWLRLHFDLLKCTGRSAWLRRVIEHKSPFNGWVACIEFQGDLKIGMRKPKPTAQQDFTYWPETFQPIGHHSQARPRRAALI